MCVRNMDNKLLLMKYLILHSTTKQNGGYWVKVLVLKRRRLLKLWFWNFSDWSRSFNRCKRKQPTVSQGDEESYWVTEISMCDPANSCQVLNRRCQFTLLAPKVNIRSLWWWVLNQESRQCKLWSTSRYRVSLFRACLFKVINSCICAGYLFWTRWPHNWTRRYMRSGRDRSERRTGLIS
jgi:hypothetical protein